MISNKLTIRSILMSVMLISMLGCRASGNHRAPIEDRSGSSRQSAAYDRESSSRPNGSRRTEQQDGRAQIHVVQKGDTLYSIAFENGMDYREVAEQNNIENPAAIQIGQKIKLLPSDESANNRANSESRPASSTTSVSAPVKDYPKIVKLPYSEQALVQIDKLQKDHGSASVAAVKPVVVENPAQDVDSGSDDSLNWGIPTKGKIISEYSESASRKGVDIAGTRGQAILASEAGKVVYSGSGLRGYGKLVIIKHNKTFLSAYAHNEQILVKEGQSVVKGQKIAEMGSTDADQVKLHFEIRKFGKPVDPSKFLNLAKS